MIANLLKIMKMMKVSNQVSIEKYLDHTYISDNEATYYVKYDPYYDLFDVYNKVDRTIEGVFNINSLIKFIKRNKKYNIELYNELLRLYPEYII